MTTVLYIHGTGVRRESFDATYAGIEQRLHAMRPGLCVRPCYWGDIGAKLGGNGNSFYFHPLEKTREHKGFKRKAGNRARPKVTAAQLGEEQERALWRRLLDDPLFEVRLRRPGARQRADRAASPPADRVAALPSHPELAAELSSRGLTATFDAAVKDLLASHAFIRAFGQPAQLNGTTMDMLARALSAYCLGTTGEDGELAASAPDELAVLIRQAFGPPDYGISTLTDPFKALALELAMQAADPWLWKFRRATVGLLGDILLYQGRGDEIGEFIRRQVGELDGPVVLLAHSLGGVMAFDLLAGADRAGLGDVRMLVTAGSQVPLLYELRALRCGVNYPDPIPRWFPSRWLNFYDESDLLSYAGEDLLHPRCTDVRLDTGKPFPKAHGAYWQADTFYKELDNALRAEGL
jgi:hypothetical protein